jgi:hypothetical protein
MLARDPDVAADMKKKLDRMIETIRLQNPEAKQRYADMRAAFAEPLPALDQLEKSATHSPGGHSLSERKSHSARHRNS